MSTDALYDEILGPGALVGDYVVDELAFQGGFAALYRAHHADTGRTAAVKVLRSHLCRSTKMLARFQREAEALNRARHPNIVDIHEAAELTDGRPFIAMAWLPGRNLADELSARGPLSAREAVWVLEEIADALEAAHQLGIVHRDLKAQNVIAVPRGDSFTPVLVDFGIAKLFTPDDRQIITTQTQLGTPQTAAPEQILGRPVDPRTDVYALGLLLYQLVTGRLPFQGENAIEIEELHLFAAAPPPSEAAPVPASFDRVAEMALRKDKEERYPSAAAFAEALRAAATGAPTPPAPARRRQPAVALWIEAHPGTDADPDAALEAIDSLLALAESRCADEGLALVVDAPNALLAVADDGDEAPARRAADRILAARGELAGLDRLTARLAVHGGTVEVESRDGRSTFVGGDLLSPGTWPEASFVSVAPE